MSDTITGAPSLESLSERATKGPVEVFEGQPCDHSDGGGGGFTLCFGGLRRTGSGRITHRLGYVEDLWKDHYPKAYAEAEANIYLLARLWNDFRAGRLHTDEALTQAIAAAREETNKTRQALKLAMQLVQRCVGQGIAFEEDDPLPEMESWVVAESIAKTLGIDINSEEYVSLFTAPPTPAQTDTAPGGRADG